METFSILDLLGLELKKHNELGLECIAGRSGLGRKLTSPSVNRPGLALAGFYEDFAYQRLQLFGRGEGAYLRNLEAQGETGSLDRYFSYPIPCCVFSSGQHPTDGFLELAEGVGCPILTTSLSTHEFSKRILRAMEDLFTEGMTVHGTLVEVFGVGILLCGESGVGKSETALELIERKHRLIADDVVKLTCANGRAILGRGINQLVAHHMEIRGLGIINIAKLFGVGAIRDIKQIQLVVELEEWDSSKSYARVEVDGQTRSYLGVHIPQVVIPIKPGRNVPIIVETAAMNERLKKMGHYPAQDFGDSMRQWMDWKATRSAYYGDEGEK